MHNKPFYFQMAVKEVVADDAGAVRIRGYASTPDLDRYRDIVEPSAFKDALGMYLKNPVLLRSHDSDRPIGLVEVATVTDKGLWIEAIVKDKVTADEINAGLMRTLSIGYIANRTELQHEDGTPFDPMKDDFWDSSLVRVIKELDLVEISVVSTPANGNALFTLAKSLKAFTRQLAFKSFGMSVKDEDGSDDAGVPAEEGEASAEAESAPSTEASEGSEEADETKESEDEEKPVCTMPDGTPGHMVDGECVPDDEEKSAPEGEDEEEAEETEEDAGEADQNDEQAEEKSTDETTQDAENGDATAPADGAEGENAEEANADAEAAGESEEGAEDDSEEKAIIVTKAVIDLLPTLKEAGAIREPEGEEKAIDLPKSVVTIVKKLHDALVSENKRANELQGKLDTTPEKKVLSPHRQFGAEEAKENATQVDANGNAVARKTQPSSFFMELFKTSND